MQFKILLVSSLLGVLEVITQIQAGAIEVIYTGDGCDCQRKLNYLVNMPPEPKVEVTNEYGYNLQRPLCPKPSVTYSFDFMAEEPKKPIPPPEVKWDLFAKVDRITAPKKDCCATEVQPKPCGCNRYGSANSYVSPERDSVTRITRNLRHPNSIDTMAESSVPTAQVMAIFLEPIKQTKAGNSKSRNKRDVSRIFMRPRNYEKRSDRLVKKYNKRLRDLAAIEKTHFINIQKPIRSRSIASAAPDTAPARIRPLQKLRSLLSLPNLRNKRDIKGEYDVIEKEREQMDLTLPEIIQFMPETLQPNFKRNQCHVGQRCARTDVRESTTKTTPTKEDNEETVTTNENWNTTPDTLTVTEANMSSSTDEKEEKQMDNSISGSHTKRNAGDYVTNDGGCPSVSKSNNPTPNPRFTYEAVSRPIVNNRNANGLDPLPQQYVGSSFIPYTSEVIDNDPLLNAGYAKPTVQQISHDHLDRIIASIVNKHSDFIEASSHAGGALVDPPRLQEEQAKIFLKNLSPWNDLSWSDEHYYHHQQYPKVHAYLRPYRTPVTAYIE